MDLFEAVLSGTRENVSARVEFCRLVSAPVGRLWVESGREGAPSAEWLVERNDLGGVLQRAVLFEWKGFMRNAPVRYIELTLHHHLCRLQAGLPNRCMAYHVFVFVTVLASSDSTLEFVRGRLRHEAPEGSARFFDEAWFPAARAVLRRVWGGEFNRDNAFAIVSSQAAWLASVWLERDALACAAFLEHTNGRVDQLVAEANMTQLFKKEQKQLKTAARSEREKKIWSRFYDGDTEFPRQIFTNLLREHLKTRKLIRNGGRRRPADPALPPESRRVRNVLEECARYAEEIGIDPADVDQHEPDQL